MPKSMEGRMDKSGIYRIDPDCGTVPIKWITNVHVKKWWILNLCFRKQGRVS